MTEKQPSIRQILSVMPESFIEVSIQVFKILLGIALILVYIVLLLELLFASWHIHPILGILIGILIFFITMTLLHAYLLAKQQVNE